MPLFVVVPARILEGVFRSLSSFAVLVLSGIEDMKTLLGMDEEEKLS